jgi:hypothetical protein
MTPRKTHEQFVQELKLIQPDLRIIEFYSKKNKIIVEDSLGIKYNSNKTCLLRGSKPSLESALDKTNAFKIKLKLVQPNLTVLSDYVNCFNKIIVSCEFGIKYSVTPHRLLLNDKPGFKSTLNKNFYFKTIGSILHNNKYSYALANYTGYSNKVKIICPEHGEFLMTPTSHLVAKCGCRKCSYESHGGSMCSVFKYRPKSKTFIYLFKCLSENEEFYKIGLSINPIKRSYQIPYKVEIIAICNSTIEELFILEQYYHKKFKINNMNYTPLKFFKGWTECFK